VRERLAARERPPDDQATGGEGDQHAG
jgi:hypothetical protein